RHQEIAGPGIVDFHILQLREGLEHFRPDDGFDIGRITCTIDDATAIDEALVRREPVVVEQVVAIFHAVILRQQLAGQFISERLGGDHLGAAWHRFGGELGNQVPEIGVTCDHDVPSGHAAAGGVDDRIRAALDAGRGTLFMDHAAQRLHRRGFAEGEVERMDMAASPVEHAADVALACHHLAYALFVERLQLMVAVACPQRLLRLQVLHLLGVEGSEDAAVLQVAIDAVAGHVLANDPAAFERHGADETGLLDADAALDGVQVAAVAVDDLAAVTPRGAKAYSGRFQYHDTESVLKQEQSGGQAGVAGADHADIRLL